MEKQKDENGKPLTFWGGVNSSNTPEEQLLQEARNEAEKVYPTESYVNDARREGYIQGYIQQAEKRKSDYKAFLYFLMMSGFMGQEVFDVIFSEELGFKKVDEVIDLYLQQLKQE